MESAYENQETSVIDNSQSAPIVIELPQLIIDEEFKSILPLLDKETYALLEENILENGIRDALVVWGDILIDGHNRYNIALEHGLPFRTVSMDFDTRDDALIWIISTQVSRRNLLPLQLAFFEGFITLLTRGLKAIIPVEADTV